MEVSINRLSFFKKIIAKILTWCLNLWTFTLKLDVTPISERICKRCSDRPKICVLWHNRLFIASKLFSRFFRQTEMYGLISPSRDGAWLAEFYKNIGIKAIRGSSKRGGREAMSQMEKVLKEGDTVTITPDGPRGPAYVAKPGIAILAKRSLVPICVVGINFRKFWRFNSWDRFFLPLPFSTVDVKFEMIMPEQYKDKTSQEILGMIQNTLFQINL